jgi:hypothetical protein
LFILRALQSSRRSSAGQPGIHGRRSRQIEPRSGNYSSYERLAFGSFGAFIAAVCKLFDPIGALTE